MTVVTILVVLHSRSFLPEVMMAPQTRFQFESSVLPSMFISSLQWGGSEIVGKLFLKSDNFVYARVPEELSIPVIFSKQFINFCIWRNNSDEDGLAMKSVYDRLTKPDLLVKEKNNINSYQQVSEVSHILTTVFHWLVSVATAT